MVEDKKEEEEKPKKVTPKKRKITLKKTNKSTQKASEGSKKPKEDSTFSDKPEKPEKPAKKTRKKNIKKKKKYSIERGKRKRSVARAIVTSGSGSIRLNSLAVSAISNKYIQQMIREPLRYIGPPAENIDVSVNIFGGGEMGQAQAARTAIAKALVSYFEDEVDLKEKFFSIDRSLLVEDTRRVERKKYCGPKARARYQKSFR